MWSQRYRDQWPDLDEREEPTDAGRRLDAGGIVLADPFEVVLRSLSEDYLRDAWQRASEILAQHHVSPDDLSWGWLHPGETSIAHLAYAAPSDYVGWTSRELKDFRLDSRLAAFDADLRNGQPALCFASTWRSLKWKIAEMEDRPQRLQPGDASHRGYDD